MVVMLNSVIPGYSYETQLRFSLGARGQFESRTPANSTQQLFVKSCFLVGYYHIILTLLPLSYFL